MVIKEGTISITSDHLPIVATFDFDIKRHSLKHSKSNYLHGTTLPHADTLEEYNVRVTCPLLCI